MNERRRRWESETCRGREVGLLCAQSKKEIPERKEAKTRKVLGGKRERESTELTA